jgi:hypothetical protein
LNLIAKRDGHGSESRAPSRITEIESNSRKGLLCLDIADRGISYGVDGAWYEWPMHFGLVVAK